MQPEAVIVRLGELMLKGRNRRRFENKIKDQLSVLLAPYPRVTTTEEFGRIYIALNGESYETIAKGLEKIFGLISYSPAVKTDLVLQDIREKALRLVQSVNPAPQTFKVSTKRANKAFPHDSLELNHLVGGYILRGMNDKLKVDVRHPQTELHIDMRPEAVYLFTEVVPGTGGYPLGSNGKAVLMLSGGIDSPVAGYLSMKRGLELEAVHFHSFPFTSERAQQKVIDLSKQMASFSDSFKLHMVPFTEIQTRLNQEGRPNLMITLMRRSMFRIAESIARQRKAGAIVTGESLGQVASQTLPSLQATGSVVAIPILRPLIMMDKTEIIKLSEKIETYEISIRPFEDCCTLFVPKSPSTNPNMEVLRRLENSMDWLHQAEEEAVRQTELLTVRWQQEEEIDQYF